MPCRNPYRLYIHLAFILRWSLKSSVNRTWTGSAFSTNESAWSVWSWALSVVSEVALNHDNPNAHNRWFVLFYHVRGPAWIEFHWNSIWLRAPSHMTSHYTWGYGTTLHDFGGGVETAFGHFLLGSHKFMIMALGSCVKWPRVFVPRPNWDLQIREFRHMLAHIHLWNRKWIR